MKAKEVFKRIAASAVAFALILLLSSCGGNIEKLEFQSHLTDEERIYYTGQEFDTMVSTAGGMFSKIPEIYAVYRDGKRSEDVSHTDKVSFSGYDPNTEGTQTITVTYREDGSSIKATYSITVRRRELCYMEADDTYRFLNPFKVGDKFVTSEITEDGAKRGVTITFRYNDPENPSESFFADDPSLDGLVFDTSGCRLDQAGRFTEAGTFTVQAVYKGLTATFKIRVTDN